MKYSKPSVNILRAAKNETKGTIAMHLNIVLNTYCLNKILIFFLLTYLSKYYILLKVIISLKLN